MNVLSFNMGSDPAGISIGIKRAFDNHGGDWTARSLLSKVNFIEYPIDLAWDNPTIIEAWEWADVVHLHHSFNSVDRLVRGHAGKRLEHKKYVLTYHGTGFRENPIGHINELRQRGVVGTVSTLDLWLLAPNDLEWLPAPINCDALQALRKRVKSEE